MHGSAGPCLRRVVVCGHSVFVSMLLVSALYTLPPIASYAARFSNTSARTEYDDGSAEPVGIYSMLCCAILLCIRWMGTQGSAVGVELAGGSSHVIRAAGPSGAVAESVASRLCGAVCVCVCGTGG